MSRACARVTATVKKHISSTVGEEWKNMLTVEPAGIGDKPKSMLQVVLDKLGATPDGGYYNDRTFLTGDISICME